MLKNQNFSSLIPSTTSTLNKSQSDNMKVMIRIRPPLPRETELGVPFRSIAIVSNNNESISLVEYLGIESDELARQRELIENPSLFQQHRFTFDYIFDIPSTQEFVYNNAAAPSVRSVLEGYNSTIFAYGQTGTGKTHTMEGFTFNADDPERGIVPRSIKSIFTTIETSSSSKTKFIIRASYLQIYNEIISDLLKPERTHLNIREDKKKGIYVENLSDWAVRNPDDIYSLLEQGASYRATSSTLMNDVSSRSHAIFIITVEQMSSMEDSTTVTKIGKLNLVDLAGSERIKVTGAKGKQLEESKRINKSLSALGNVINALTDPKGNIHIPYRDSKLTRLLADSLGGNCKTTMITTISPAHDFFNESLSSLLFAKRAKKIKNRPIVNQDLNHRALISQYEIELRNLRKELMEKNRLLQSNELMIELEEQKKKAEEDCREAMQKLEQASMKYIKEREEKTKLEKKIQLMDSQMITGGKKIEDTPQFRSALEERQTVLLKEFDNKFQEFEKERQRLEEDQAEVDRYKQLLLNQRDIMLSLTTKLNERDGVIVQLQEEIDVYDKINHQQEELLDLRLGYINTLIQLCKDKDISIPNNILNMNKEEKFLYENDTYKSKSKETKKFLTYETEKNGNNEFDNSPLTMLSSEEKVKELKGIIKEKENEINILKLVSQKFISTSCESKDGKVDIDSILKSLENGFELHGRIREAEMEKLAILRDLESKNEVLNSLKTENDLLQEQNVNFEKVIDQNERDISYYNETLGNINEYINEIIVTHCENNYQLRSELMKISTMINATNNKNLNNSNLSSIRCNSNINPNNVSGISFVSNINDKGYACYIKDKENKNTGSYSKMARKNKKQNDFISKFINSGK